MDYPMTMLHEKRAMALVTVLAIITIATIMLMIIFYYVQKGTEISALQRRYSTAKEASFGAIEVLTKEIIPVAISGSNLDATLSRFTTITTASVTQGADNPCFRNKLTKSSTSWGDEGATNCEAGLDPKTNPDLRFTLRSSGGQPFTIFTKIVDTVPGNSNTSGVELEGLGVAQSGSGMITAQHFPYLYRIEVQGERQQNPDERANFEILYGY